MKVISKVILGLSLSAQIFAAPLEARQSTITTIDTAVNRLLSRVLTEVYTLSMLFKHPSVNIYSNISTSQTLHFSLWACSTSQAC
jgi:hypothetical protein